MSLTAPPVDDRNFDDIVNQTLALAKQYCPEWKPGAAQDKIETADPGVALVHLFARLMEIIITRLNQVPDKYFLAFLDFIGAKLRPPVPAKALLRFFLSEKAKVNGRVPARTQVATEESEDREAQIFETEKELVVTPVKLINTFTLDPENDRYNDTTSIVTGVEDGQFEVFKGKDLIEHIFYLGDDLLFGLNETSAKGNVTLRFAFQEGSSGFQNIPLKWEYSAGAGRWQPLPFDQQNFSGNPLEVTFHIPGDIVKDNVSDHEHYWIRIRLDDAISSIPIDRLPEIEDITGSIDCSADGVLPDACFTNHLPIDPPESFYPFGPAPTYQHIFYIASDEVFSKSGADISISIVFDEPGVQGSEESLALTWEYWDGEAWQPIDNIIDPTNHFTQSPAANERIRLVCPQIEPKEINLLTRYWIRIRISSGHYGLSAHYDSVEQGWVDGNLHPPKIREMKLGYQYNSGLHPIEKIILKNNFKYLPVEPGAGSFLPFVPLEEEDPALYLGFDALFSHDAVLLFFQVVREAQSSRQLQWEYAGPDEWRRLQVKDETWNLSRQGHIQFIGPKDFTRTENFGLSRYWLRVRLISVSALDLISPELQRIYLNTVWAENTATVKNELLGSSDGSADQTFQLKQFPVMPGQQVWVKEPEMPAADEYEKIVREEGEDAVAVTRDEKEAVTEIRVRWHAKDNFYSSGPRSRHYMIEPIIGEIRFGDGSRGMIPPMGTDNIWCSLYRTGGGVRGNVEKSKITRLKAALPHIAGVTNPEPAAGGMDAETIDEIKTRGPILLKHRDRAVTTEDFEWLMKEAPGDIALCKCIPVSDYSDKHVIVVIVPDVDDPKPYPSQALIRQVQEYLYQRILATLFSPAAGARRIQVTGPGYIEISVQADVIPNNIEQASIVQEKVIANLENFLHPLKGGPDNKGWPFGRAVHISEIMTVIQNTEGVDYVKSLRLR
ncbi:MAG: putative baseplate assembly protein, partial [Candidatus Aminicenantes bacterium]|nr:putative baseplate assembly protein [Candidatus Aminicenantes bacterium]NIM83161.1 putative baseplate assembly protein [Candidatus Aminicenantes bacterium]NIN22537.1 putative baseplate assembly protein [Candidatus Aminicenantes bacterium]NIN46308.1 putative baseplate assembly protein [Candidatus Aminicenantes bacterium]NIN89147.1 putative baseplate assembly protein [Candidatus Aminicenantes bacterium]